MHAQSGDIFIRCGKQQLTDIFTLFAKFVWLER